MKPEKLTPAMLSALIDWQADGKRSVKIKIEPGYEFKLTDIPEGPQVKIWVYDFTCMEGQFIEDLSDLPTEKDLFMMKRKRVEEKQAELKAQLAAMEKEI